MYVERGGQPFWYRISERTKVASSTLSVASLTVVTAASTS